MRERWSRWALGGVVALVLEGGIDIALVGRAIVVRAGVTNVAQRCSLGHVA